MIPKMIKIRQRFNNEHLADIENTVKNEFARSGLNLKKDSNIALAVGSRGVSNIDRIVKAVVDCVKAAGAYPFIVPAMGSHGGATRKGQKEVLEGYGITEEYTGAPIKSSMDVVELPRGNLQNKVFIDKYAYDADGIIVINKVKVHTDFHGPLESGLIKMCVIGLGKHKQALEIHKYGVYGLRELIIPTARQILKHTNIILGIGIVENAYNQTAVIKAIRPGEIENEEMKLLEQCRKNMARIPSDKLDVLMVDQLGKNISGTGMDTNIIGRIRIEGETEPNTPDIKRIILSDITDESHGNAVGVGLADFITKKLFKKIDFKTTYENALTSTFIERAKIPIIADTDKQALKYALRACGPIQTEKARIIRIKNTLFIDEMYVSDTILGEIKQRNDIEVIGDPIHIFTDKKNLIDF